MMDCAVRLENVSKSYGAHKAVDDLSLVVPKGSIYGFIGPNGSGKTTTMRLILHIIFPDSGSIEVLGNKKRRAANDRIGYLPEERGLYKKLKVSRQLAYFAALKGYRGRAKNGVINEWLGRMGLAEWGRKNVDTLSRGMMQKIQFICAIMTQPDLVILDEPFGGLDPVNAEMIRQIILELRDNGTTVIFSTHDMATAEQMCDSIFMIHQGVKVLDGSLAQIQKDFSADTIRLKLAGELTLDLASLPGVTAVNERGRFWDLHFDGDPQEVLRTVSAAARVEHFELVTPSLHDIFVRIAGTQGEDKGNE